MDSSMESSMERAKEEILFEAILSGDQETVTNLLAQGASPNKIVSKGKTCLGICAYNGNVTIFQLLLNACKKPNSSGTKPKAAKPLKKGLRTNKRKLRHQSDKEEGVKCKNPSDASKDVGGSEEAKKSDDKNEASCEVCRAANVGENLESSPDSDLEWDEDICNVADATNEDEESSSMYKWYAAILESTGAAIASAHIINTDSIDQQDAYMGIALHYAVEKEHVEVVKMLVEAGCKIDTPGHDGFNSLHVAVIKNNMEIIKTLIAGGGNINYKTHEKMTALHFAASRGFLDVVKFLVKNGANLDARDMNDRTALYIATGRGLVDIVRYLVFAGANVNKEEIHGYTPLCEAVWQRSPQNVEVLLTAGARITHSHRLLHAAVMRKDEQIVNLLTLHGGGINLHNDNGDTPLLLAVRVNQLNIAKLLVSKGANVNVRNNITGSNVLHTAVESIEEADDFEAFLLYFIEHKVNIDATALTGDTALNRALLLSKRHAVILLVRHGADVNTYDSHSRGLDNLLIASRHFSPTIISLLVRAGHHATAPDTGGRAPKWGSPEYFVQQASRNVRSLQDACRIKIRNLVKEKNMHRCIQGLPLPEGMKSFLMLQDTDYMEPICNDPDCSKRASELGDRIESYW